MAHRHDIALAEEDMRFAEDDLAGGQLRGPGRGGEGGGGDDQRSEKQHRADGVGGLGRGVHRVEREHANQQGRERRRAPIRQPHKEVEQHGNGGVGDDLCDQRNPHVLAEDHVEDRSEVGIAPTVRRSCRTAGPERARGITCGTRRCPAIPTGVAPTQRQRTARAPATRRRQWDDGGVSRERGAEGGAWRSHPAGSVRGCANAGSAGGGEAAALARGPWADPECEQTSARQRKAKTHRLSRDRCELSGRPSHRQSRAVTAHRHAGRTGERRQTLPSRFENFDAQLATDLGVDEQMFAGERDDAWSSACQCRPASA